MDLLQQDAKRPKLDILQISDLLVGTNYPQKSIHRIRNCGNPTNNFIMIDCGCGTRVLPLQLHCERSFCPECSLRRRLRLKRRLLPLMTYFKDSSLYKWSFLTISPQNYTDYHKGKQHIRRSWKKFLKHPYIKERIKGGFCLIEVAKKGESWNFHIHAIIYSRYLDNMVRGFCQDCRQNFLKQDRETGKWYCANRSCNALYEGVLRPSKIASAFSSVSQSSSFVHISKSNSPSSVLNYMTKYLTEQKDSFTDDKDFIYHIANSYHDRPITAFGMFYNFKQQIGQHSFLTKKPRCPHCKEVFRVSFDIEVSYLIRENQNRPPDPITLLNYTE